ncbi:hypothetical protein [Actinomadura kijaniata]|uniref:hypothetical protein n=1 Tax=Actinomadura kijaniata TaxID=46161 RepID=UPI00082FD8A7|nr:hypothetical protein [Actinomadura kijaniata]
MRNSPRPLVTIGVLLSAAGMLVFGFWALLSPAGFIDYVNYHPVNEHLAHDAGAFQIGIGATLLFALVWSDALVVSLAGFAVASGLHTMTHFMDRHLGGHGTDVPILGLFTLIALATIYLRLRKRETT